MQKSRNIDINKALPIVLVVLVIIAIISFVANRAVNNAATQNATANQNETVTNQAVQNAPAPTTVPSAPSVDEIVATLPDSISDDDKRALAERAQTDADVLWIAQHADQYAFEGDYVQSKMLRLAAYEPDSVEFVRNVFDKFGEGAFDPWDGTVTKGSVPHLYQWDTKWGYLSYSDTPFGMSGCCPTSFSMVAMALTGSPDCTPAVAAGDAAGNGYVVSYEGTTGSFIPDRANAYGFNAYETYLSGGDLVFLLQQGNAYVIINVGPGDFTPTGHFIVATGIDANGNVIVNDPYSTANSAKTWDADRLVNQAITFFVCYA